MKSKHAAMLLCILAVLFLVSGTYASPTLRVSSVNPRYFVDHDGKGVYLTGSHTWTNFVDFMNAGFSYSTYLDFLQANNHNFLRLWMWEQAKWVPWTTAGTIVFFPVPYSRPGPGTALDGKSKFDLHSFDQTYFDRMRQCVVDAKSRNIYVSIMLFNGWSTETKEEVGNPWRGHPMNSNNNINGINGDTNSDGQGSEVHRNSIPAITALQEAYVRKVIDTINDLDNVLYEICNECDSGSVAWQNHMIDFIKSYEATKPLQHPVGMTVAYPGGNNSSLFASRADWISPNKDGGYNTAPPAASGAKVILSDTDHIFGVGGDRVWAWKTFTRGMNILFMDPYNDPSWDPSNPEWAILRSNMGWIRRYAEKMNLLEMTPRGDLASTGYALARPSTSDAKYLVYAPSGGTFTVNLRNTVGALKVEWFRPATQSTTSQGTVAGGSTRSFYAPFTGDAVLYLTSVSDANPPTTPTSLEATATSSAQIRLSWRASTDDTAVAGYKIWRNGVAVGTTGNLTYLDTNLLPSTTYTYQVAAYDAADNYSGRTAPVSATTLAQGDTTPPAITNIIVSSISRNSARITWVTNESSDSTVEYGRTTAYGSTVRNTSRVTSHIVNLSGLSAWTAYHFRVRSTDAAGNTATSADRTFRTMR